MGKNFPPRHEGYGVSSVLIQNNIHRQNNKNRKIVVIPTTIDIVKLRHLSIAWKTQIARKKFVRLQKAHLSQ